MPCVSRWSSSWIRRILLVIAVSASTGVALAAEVVPEWHDLGIGRPITFIGPQVNRDGFVVAFGDCKVALLDKASVVQQQWELPGCGEGCQPLFKAHAAELDSLEVVAVASYSGRVALLSRDGMKEYPAHEAAVADAFLVQGGLLTSSDDGSVRLTSLTSGIAPRTLATGIGVARVLLPLSPTASGKDAFLIGFDTGEILVVGDGTVQRFSSGVGRINGLAMSADHRSIIAGGYNGRVRQIDMESGDVHDLLVAEPSVSAIALGSDNKLAVVDGAGKLYVIDVPSKKTVRVVDFAGEQLTAVSFGQDGKALIVGNGKGAVALVN